MKKTLVSALTTALVVGAASTTFAAANPFADVPADHWAYDAVAQLVQDGVVNGYAADGTFKGDQNMSRYEMAQIVAKAMAKSDAADNKNKALIDKLAAEFSDELANLGVRVANLEAKVDNVKWNGKILYDWSAVNYDANGKHRNVTDNDITFRLEPSMTINENWTGHARIDAVANVDDSTAGNEALKRVWAEGVYGKADIKLGRFNAATNASHGLLMDENITGASVTYAPTSNWTLNATAGRIAQQDVNGGDALTDKNGNALVPAGSKLTKLAGTYWGVEAAYQADKWDAGIGYRHIGAQETFQDDTSFDKSFNVVDLGAGYAFDKNVKLSAEYAFGPSLNGAMENASKNAYRVNLKYKGADNQVAKSWGAWVEYKSLSPYAAFCSNGDLKNGFAGVRSLKGWELGAEYTWAKNILTTVKYFNGKDTLLNENDSVRGFWSETEFAF